MREFECYACGCSVLPESGATYSGRTGFVLCYQDRDGSGVPLTDRLAAGLRGQREWTQEDENHVTGVQW